MCGRYVSPDAISIEREFALALAGDQWHFPANFNVAPSQNVPAIRAQTQGGQGTVHGVSLRWGTGPRHSIFNAGIETLATGPSSGAAWKQARRCILPALGFYEWHANTDGTRQPYYIHVEDQDVFGFAALWGFSVADANAVTESGSEWCVIITVPANSLLSGIHNGEARMPAILTRPQRQSWLFDVPETAARALGAYPSEKLVAYPVSGRVNALHSSGETLVEPLETDAD
jgi:putative SOS response-associated peptidase YedK